MSLKNNSHEETKKMSMVELASLLLLEKKKGVPFKELFDEITALKEFTDDQKGTYIAQLYTDLNMDGRFVNLGSNTWGLKRWYPVNQVIEETKPAPKKKAKKKPVKKKPEVEEEEDEDTLDNDLEELTADFSKLDGKDDVDEEDEDLDMFAEELDIDFDDEDLDDEYDDEDEENTDDNQR